jgi:hypothetical protein
VTRLKWILVSVHLEIVVIFKQDRCIVCTKRTIGSELFCTRPMELLSHLGHVKSRFGPFGDNVSVSAT